MVDFLRSCYRTLADFGPPVGVIPIEWFFVDEDTPSLDRPTYFYSTNWLDRYSDQSIPFGEVANAPRTWVNGQLPPGIRLTHQPCGTAGQWASLEPANNVALYQGFPRCCLTGAPIAEPMNAGVTVSGDAIPAVAIIAAAVVQADLVAGVLVDLAAAVSGTASAMAAFDARAVVSGTAARPDNIIAAAVVQADLVAGVLVELAAAASGTASATAAFDARAVVSGTAGEIGPPVAIIAAAVVQADLVAGVLVDLAAAVSGTAEA